MEEKSMIISGYPGESTTFDSSLVHELQRKSRFKLFPSMKYFARKPRRSSFRTVLSCARRRFGHTLDLAAPHARPGGHHEKNRHHTLSADGRPVPRHHGLQMCQGRHLCLRTLCSVRDRGLCQLRRLSGKTRRGTGENAGRPRSRSRVSGLVHRQGQAHRHALPSRRSHEGRHRKKAG